MSAPYSYPPELRAAIVAEYAAGASTIELGRAHGIGASTILRWLAAAGVERRPAFQPAADKTCEHDGCTQRHHARGYCRLHYAHHIEGSVPREHSTDRDERLEDCRWMAEHGETLTGAAGRLGIGRSALEAWLRKYDPDTLRVLSCRDLWPVESRATFHGVAS